MNYRPDSVDAALAALKGRNWDRPEHRAQLEEQLMQEFTNLSTPAKIRRGRTLAIGILVLGGVTLAAAGGIAVAKRWTVTTQVNGKIVDTRQVAPDASGNAKFNVATGDGRDAKVEVQDQGGGRKQVSVELAPGSAGKTVTVELGGDQKADEPAPE